MSIKNRTTLFAVVRTHFEDHEGLCPPISVIISIHATPNGADEAIGRAEQAMADAGFYKDDFQFEVQPGTYYDE